MHPQPKIFFMKKPKLSIFIVVFILSIGAYSQNKSKAKSITKEMTEVLELDKKESKAIYKIQKYRLDESDNIKKDFNENPTLKKENLKKLGKNIYNQLKEIVGKEKLSKWKEYKTKN